MVCIRILSRDDDVIELFSVEGIKITITELDDNAGLSLDYEGLTLDMKYNEETTSTGWTEGEMKTFSWRTGPNSLRIRNTVEDLGVVEHKDLRFTPTGVQVLKILNLNFLSSHYLDLWICEQWQRIQSCRES